MSVTEILGGIQFPPQPYDVVASSAFTDLNYSLGALNRIVMSVFRVPKNCTIRKIGFRVTAAPGLVGTAEARLETVSNTTGVPTGTLAGANTNITFVPAVGWQWHTLTADYVATMGEVLAAGTRITAFVSGSFAVRYSQANMLNYNSGHALPFIAYAAGSIVDYFPNIGIELSDGTKLLVMGMGAVYDATAYSWASDNPPDRRGIRFKFPFSVRLSGFHFYNLAINNWKWILYNSDGSTILKQSDTLDGDQRSGALGNMYEHIDPVVLSANTFYRLVILPLTVTARNLLASVIFNSAADMDTIPGGQNFHYTTCNGAPANEASWTNVLTERPFISLVIDGINVNSGSVSILLE